MTDTVPQVNLDKLYMWYRIYHKMSGRSHPDWGRDFILLPFVFSERQIYNETFLTFPGRDDLVESHKYLATNLRGKITYLVEIIQHIGHNQYSCIVLCGGTRDQK